MRIKVRLLLVGMVMACASACDASDPDEDAIASVDEYIASCDGVSAGEPSTSDENHIRFVEADRAGTVVSGCDAPQLKAPNVDTLSISHPPGFEFTPTHAECAAQWAPSRAPGCVQPTKGRTARLWSYVEPLLWGTAHAHCPAFTGENYLFELRLAGGKTPVYVAMLSTTAFTPNLDIWQRELKGLEGKTVEITVQRAVFFRGEIREGPFVQNSPYVFEVVQ